MTAGASLELRTPEVTLDLAPSRREVRRLDERLNEDLAGRAGTGSGRELAIVARDAAGRSLGGISGITWGGSCELLTLWVDEGHRRRGIATRLLQAAESEAGRRDCRQVLLFTHSEREPLLYLRLGYRIAGEIPDYPRRLTAYWLHKLITTPQEEK